MNKELEKWFLNNELLTSDFSLLATYVKSKFKN